MEVSLTNFSWISDYNSWFTSYFVFPPCTGFFDNFVSVHYKQAEQTPSVSHMVLYKRMEHGTQYRCYL